jgi:hypothetical protein
VLEYKTDEGITVKIRIARIDDAPSLQRSSLPGNTLEEVENFLKRDVHDMKAY